MEAVQYLEVSSAERARFWGSQGLTTFVLSEGDEQHRFHTHSAGRAPRGHPRTRKHGVTRGQAGSSGTTAVGKAGAAAGGRAPRGAQPSALGLRSTPGARAARARRRRQCQTPGARPAAPLSARGFCRAPRGRPASQFPFGDQSLGHPCTMAGVSAGATAVVVSL